MTLFLDDIQVSVHSRDHGRALVALWERMACLVGAVPQALDAAATQISRCESHAAAHVSALQRELARQEEVLWLCHTQL
jgi:hypothetical protein